MACLGRPPANETAITTLLPPSTHPPVHPSTHTCTHAHTKKPRRAKRLKKLNRMMTSSVAQQAAERFKRHTLLLTGLITLTHVVCFVVLVTQINARYECVCCDRHHASLAPQTAVMLQA